MKLNNYSEVSRILKEKKRIIFITGAGISAESNIPTFRGTKGLWKEYNFTDLSSPGGFEKNPEVVWEWYQWRRDLIKKAPLNPGHIAIAEFEKIKPEMLLITMNTDNMHLRAGTSKDKIIEIHGNMFNVFCEKNEQCPEGLSRENAIRMETLSEPLPKCKCGGKLRPNVIWFGEKPLYPLMKKCVSALEKADVLVIVGTSNVVEPVANFPKFAKENGAILVEVNIEDTPLTNACDFIFRDSASVVLSKFVEYLKN
ncbi:MAG: NAD-dependent deacetylase [Promethearchaeota archaeon]